MAELEDSDRAKPADVRGTIALFCVIVCIAIAFLVFGNISNHSNTGAGVPTGERDLKVGVEGATSNPQAVVPR
jgi:hypothetical protein